MNRSNIIEIQTIEQLQECIKGKNPYILYFSTQNCNVCHAVFPKLIEIIDNYSIKVLKIDPSASREIAGQFIVFTVPTVLIVQEGKVLLRESRFIDFHNIERTLQFLKDAPTHNY